MFSILVSDGSLNNRFSLEKLTNVLNEQNGTLFNKRIEIEPSLYDAYLKQRELNHKKKPKEPKIDFNLLYPGTWYLKQVDENYRRVYERCPENKNSNSSFDANVAQIILNKQLSQIQNKECNQS